MLDPVFDIFREEAREHLGALEKGLLDLETIGGPEARRSAIDNLFRHAHSLKGDARAIGLPTLQAASQVLEDILDAVRENPDSVGRAVIDQGLAQFDLARQAFENWNQSLAGGEEGPPPAEGAAPPPTPIEEPIDSAAPPPAVQAAPVVAAPPPAVQAVSAPPALPEESFTVRVPSERLDRMLSLAGELRISQRGVTELMGRLTDLGVSLSGVFDGSAREAAASIRQQLEGCLDQIQGFENDLQKKQLRDDLLLEALETDIQQARLLPLTMLTDLMRRSARDLAQSLDKRIRYDVDVGDILLDKAVIEALRNPLLHLLRNAADHGLETPDERRAAGKSEEGVFRISASRRGPSVRIVVSDDGRGVNFDRVRSRIRQTEGLSEAELGALTEQELGRYLFKPGFTTARTRDTVSGRGVGLDVVLDTVHRLQGRVELESTSPSGTAFALTVPVTVSTIRILTVSYQGQFYGVPSTLIDRTGRVRYKDLHELEGHLVLGIDSEPVRWVSLGDLIGAPASATPENGQACPFLLVHQGGRRAAVAVDDLEDESEVLLKPLGFPLGSLPGIVGATIRPDGSVQLVLDLSSSAFGVSASKAALKLQDQKTAGRILVVDDSPTTRTIMRNVFTAAGYTVRTASDGVDALDRLRSGAFDLVVSDVEMPRMDGFELTRQIKARLRLPVILVTGMEKEEARRKGLEAGADAYIVKSTFQGEGLLEVVRQLV